MFDIKYMPHTSIKGQVLADLVAKFTKYSIMVGAEEEEFGGEQVSTISIYGQTWKLMLMGQLTQPL